LLLLFAAIGVAVVKFRADAARSRKEVLARLSEEREVRGDYSPTAELFREVGVPVPEPVLATAPAAAPPPPAPVPPAPAPPAAMPHIPTAAPLEPASPLSAPPPPSVSAPVATHQLTDVFRGIRMPAELAPLGEMTPTVAAFVTRRGAREVRDGLAAELARLGAQVSWPEPTVALVVRDGRSAMVAIHPRPDIVRDLDGSPCFPTAPPDSCVVRMSVA